MPHTQHLAISRRGLGGLAGGTAGAAGEDGEGRADADGTREQGRVGDHGRRERETSLPPEVEVMRAATASGRPADKS